MSRGRERPNQVSSDEARCSRQQYDHIFLTARDPRAPIVIAEDGSRENGVTHNDNVAADIEQRGGQRKRRESHFDGGSGALRPPRAWQRCRAAEWAEPMDLGALGCLPA